MNEQNDSSAHTNKSLSDEALAVFAFAAYHQLERGKQVARVVIKDEAGHQADSKAVAELTERDVAETENNRIVFTTEGEFVLAKIIDAIQKAGR